MAPGPCQPVSGWGGVFQNLGPLPFQGPLKKFFPKAKVPKIFRNTTFPRKFHNSAHKSFTFYKFCNSSMPRPPPRKLGPLFFGGGGCYNPWHSPVWPQTPSCLGKLNLLSKNGPSKRILKKNTCFLSVINA